MNSSASCHEITDCPGIYVDAFRGPYLKKARDNPPPGCCFILTHYHSDHYGNLPRDNKYEGPAQIHCSPITARLLRKIHKVPSCFVVEHPIGHTWVHSYDPPTTRTIKRKRSTWNHENNEIRITFYDANHCPGAVIVVFQLHNDDDDEIVHIHTGDMRYHAVTMTKYTLLREAALQRKIDTVLLDTTYANPKHDFIPQETAIETIATQVESILGTATSTTNNYQKNASLKEHTLVLLSCYSIGKERVLWEVSQRTGQFVYVTERKYEMLQCIITETEIMDSNTAEHNLSEPHQYHHACHRILQRCTRDPNASDVHVIPMGLAGEMWPYFRPNYAACAEYAQKLNKPYSRVVAFIPTGWADASNWNKKNAISKAQCKGLHIEIRLISYSEHSAFSELQDFVRFLRPRKVVPTVFKDENDRRKIEARFQIDTNRAKQFFISSLQPEKLSDDISITKTNSLQKKSENEEEDPVDAEALSTLVVMGFSREKANTALQSVGNNVEAAIDWLFRHPDSSPMKKYQTAPTTSQYQEKVVVDKKPQGSPSSTSSTRTIKDFFQAKKK